MGVVSRFIEINYSSTLSTSSIINRSGGIAVLKRAKESTCKINLGDSFKFN